jgi:hypothetical protein
MNSNPENKTPEKSCRGRRCWRFFPLIILGIVLVKGALVYLVWNAFIPDLFHAPVLNFGHAIGLVVLAKILFGHGPGHGWRHRHGRFGPPWRRMEGLSEEERQKLREELRGHCH